MRGRPKQNRRNDRAGDDGAHEDRRRFAAGQIDKQNAADCAQHGNAAEHERINDRRRLRCQSQRADQNRADQTHGVSFKNVRRHACAIADVVAHVIGNRCRIARIIFLEAFLDLAHEIGAHIRRFRVNAAAESRENADQARAQCQSDQAGHGLIMPNHLSGNGIKNCDR